MLTPGRLAIALALALVLGVPFLLRPAAAVRPLGNTPRLIIITPHVRQITSEFGPAFERWHKAVYGQEVTVDFRGPFGTSEIVKLLQSQYAAAIKRGEIAPDGSCPAGTISFDVVFGGGSFDHGRLKDPKNAAAKVVVNGEEKLVQVSMSVPAGFPTAQLEAWYGPNAIGAQKLYDPDGHWLGAALSGFGIVYNKDVLARMGVPAPTSFADLARPELVGWVALADPRQSGSIATSFDSILSMRGWDEGWKLLREMTANARSFTSSSTKPPIDVSQGEAACGLAIDFYGRSQAQAILKAGEDPDLSRLGYVDPKGEVYIDADPISILRGAPNPQLAQRFVEFCLSHEGQALWQLPARTLARGANNPVDERGVPLGPERYELRRMPVRRATYEKYQSFFIDKANPFELATTSTPAGWRGLIAVMMAAFAIDNAHEQRLAWLALNRARKTPGFPAATLAEMERLYYAWPATPAPDGRELAFEPANAAAIMQAWRSAPGYQTRCEIRYTAFFRDSYRRVVELAGEQGR